MGVAEEDLAAEVVAAEAEVVAVDLVVAEVVVMVAEKETGPVLMNNVETTISHGGIIVTDVMPPGQEVVGEMMVVTVAVEEE